MNKNIFFVICLVLIGALSSCQSTTIKVMKSEQASNRLLYGLQNLEEALSVQGIKFGQSNANYTLFVGEQTDASFQKILKEVLKENTIEIDSLPKEGFRIFKQENNLYCIGADRSGVLYGLLELKDRIKKLGAVPKEIDFTDAPEMVIRGTAVGLQKTNILPGRHVYEYPIDEENFPWFYNKELWVSYLDRMVKNRYNSLYLWSGHPFASLVKLEDYPYAVEVNDATFERNKEMYAFLTEEADKRGLWVIQMFYNIILPKPFAEHHQLKTQERNREITPLIEDYTRKSITAFMENYPNVGLLVTRLCRCQLRNSNA